MPPLPPEEVEWVEALKAVKVAQFAVYECFVALGVHVGVSAAAEGFAATTVSLDDRRLDAVQPEVLEGVPGARLVGGACDTLSPVLWAEDHRSASGLANETAVAVLADAVEAGVSDECTAVAIDYPDTPDDARRILTHLVEPFGFILEHGGDLPAEVARDKVALHAAAVRKVNEVAH